MNAPDSTTLQCNVTQKTSTRLFSLDFFRGIATSIIRSTMNPLNTRRITGSKPVCDAISNKDGNLILTDRQNHRISIFTTEGKPVERFGEFGEGSGVKGS